MGILGDDAGGWEDVILLGEGTVAGDVVGAQGRLAWLIGMLEDGTEVLEGARSQTVDAGNLDPNSFLLLDRQS